MNVVPGRRVFTSAALSALITIATAAVCTLPAAAAPAKPVPARPVGGTAGSTVIGAEQAGRIAASFKQHLATSRARGKTAKAVKLTSAPNVVTFLRDPDATGDQLGTMVIANAGGDLVVRAWFTGATGWTEWTNWGGKIEGVPQFGFETDLKTLSFFARSAGRVVRAAKPQEWADFGIATNRDPVSFINWGNGNLQVYAIADNGAVWEKYQTYKTHVWSSWGSAGGAVTTGTVTPYFNWYNGNVSLFVNSGNALAERWWNARNGAWSSWSTLAGTITSSPVAFFNDYNNNTQIYANRNGDIVEMYWNAANGEWIGWGDFNGNATGEPAVIQHPKTANVQIYANSGGTIHETYWSPGRPWSGWNAFPGATIVGTPSVTHNDLNGNVQLMAVDDNGNLVENYWSQGRPWSGWHTIGG